MAVRVHQAGYQGVLRQRDFGRRSEIALGHQGREDGDDATFPNDQTVVGQDFAGGFDRNNPAGMDKLVGLRHGSIPDSWRVVGAALVAARAAGAPDYLGS